MGKVAALAIIAIASGVLFLIAKAEGVDFGSQWSDLTDKFNSEVAAAGADLGVSSDPVSVAMPIIKGFEQWSATRYPDPPGSGKFSIAWGHQIQPGEPYDENTVMDRSEGDDLLRIDLAKFYACVTDNVTAELTVNQTAALISFCYNVGCAAFRSSTMLRLLNDGDIDGAAAQFPQWIHAGGLVNDGLVSRRDQEMELFNS